MRKIKKIMLWGIILITLLCTSACGSKLTGEQEAGSFGYKITYNADDVYFQKGEINDYFQCKDTIDMSVGQGVRVTRYENGYSFDKVIDAINNQTERGFDVVDVIIGKKAYPAYMVRFNFADSEGNMYTECDYQITYGDVSLMVTAVYDVDHADEIDSMIKSLDLN
jgi:hypothetical protein